jgi:hypothetical protein
MVLEEDQKMKKNKKQYKLTHIPVNKKIQTLKLIITELSTLQPFRLFLKLPQTC